MGRETKTSHPYLHVQLELAAYYLDQIPTTRSTQNRTHRQFLVTDSLWSTADPSDAATPCRRLCRDIGRTHPRRIRRGSRIERRKPPMSYVNAGIPTCVCIHIRCVHMYVRTSRIGGYALTHARFEVIGAAPWRLALLSFDAVHHPIVS